MKSKEELGSVLAGHGTKEIGAIVYWSLSAVSIPREDLRAKLTEIDLGDAMGRKPAATRLLSTAVVRSCTGNNAVFARRIGQSWGIVIESNEPGEDGAPALAHHHVVTISADNATGELSHAWPLGSERGLEELTKAGAVHLLGTIKARYEVGVSNLDTEELSTLLVAAMAGKSKSAPLLSGISLRESGGIYFVEASHLDQLRALVALLKTEARGCTFTVFGITGDGENLSNAAEAARRGFTAQLEELRTEVGAFKAGLIADQKVASDRNLTVRAERFRALRDRVTVFTDILGDAAAELTGEITKTWDHLRAELERV